jgi:hypothetical protein
LAKQYNENVRDGSVPGLSLFATELPTTIPSSGKDEQVRWLKTVRECFEQVGRALREYCKKYRIAEGDFVFAPEGSKSVLEDGSVEREVENIYVLTMDIIGSTNSEAAQECKEQLRMVFRRFADKKIYFEETRNDAFAVCSHDPLTLWDIANSIWDIGESLKRDGDRFAGTRKGLSFGTVRVVEKSNGDFLIGDARPPHLLPMAFTMVDAIDKHIERNDRNAYLLIEPTAFEQAAARLNLKRSECTEVHAEAKHFFGRAYLVRLDRKSF